jgi:ABC-type iron transport system FetAB ATPase subunit
MYIFCLFGIRLTPGNIQHCVTSDNISSTVSTFAKYHCEKNCIGQLEQQLLPRTVYDNIIWPQNVYSHIKSRDRG